MSDAKSGLMLRQLNRARYSHWESYLERIRHAARMIARDQGFTDDGALTFPHALPEFRPDYLGETIAAAMLASTKRRVADEEDWERWRPHLLALIQKVLNWPEGTRVRATALAAAKDALGIRFGDGFFSDDETLAETCVDLRCFSAETLPQGQPAAVQIRYGHHLVGLAFISGLEPYGHVSRVESILDQARDFSLRKSTGSFAGHWPFWRAAFGYLADELRRRPRGDALKHLRDDAKRAVSAGIQTCLHRYLAPSRSGNGASEPATPVVADTPIPVLMYHRVSDDGDPALNRYRVTPAQFRLQMEWLKHNGFEPISLDAMKEMRQGRRQLPRRPVLISFDDGYSDFYHNAWPVLRALDFPSVMFVVAGRVGERSDWDEDLGRPEPLMTWQQLLEISAAGVSIGSHSVLHRRFSRLSVLEAHGEMQDSASIIERNLGRRPSSFCYPYGVYDRSIEQILPICGYEFGFTCDVAAASLRGNPLRLPRIEVMGSDDLDGFAASVMAQMDRPRVDIARGSVSSS
jgi:peptidoglycan/xylan/chitin deacetylase (PgdA/CDA1 family)